MATKPKDRDRARSHGRRAPARERTHFGYRDVDLAQRQDLVNDVFSKVAGRYDLMNDLMSGGLHRLWKDALVDWLAPPRGVRPFEVLDMAGGTGDIALRILAASPGARVTVCDINADMLAEGAKRARRRGERIAFALGNAECLPFPTRCFDAYTIAFGIRNVTRIEAALAEAYRVLKPGGRLLCLEFSSVTIPGLDALYEAFSMAAIPAIGKVVTGDGAPYRYLVESIRRFPNQPMFARMIEAAGFARVKYRDMGGGIVALHSGWRL
jgi:demethylmenaquinone methyltransferase/2-methoxy-6-polyprenyl-1,4-benzoquinol methylase